MLRSIRSRRAFEFTLAALLVLAGCSDDDDGGTEPPDPDTTPPPVVLDFLAVPGDGEVTLSWGNPTGGDWVGTMVRRDTAPPAGPESGVLVLDTTGQSHVDRSVTNDSTYIYAAYSYDLAGNFSEPAQATATPHEPIVVTFPDANLEQAMRHATGVSAGDITDLDLLLLTQLNLDNQQIADLTGLEWCVNVVELHLGRNDITDASNLGVLAGMSALADLYLDGADLTTLAPLADLTGLSVLTFDSPQVTDLTPLASLTELEHLRFADLAITSLAPLSGLSGLEVLQFNRCEGVDSFADLGGMTQLVVLQATDVASDDLSPLSALVNLDILNVSGCLATDIGDLVGLTQLRDLSLHGMPLLREAVDVQIPALEAAGVTVNWTPLIAVEVVGTWAIASVTVDGSPVDPAEFFEWEAETDTAVMYAHANSDYAYEELDASGAVLYTETGYLDVIEDQFAVTVETENGEDIQDYGAFVGSWAVDGDGLVLTAEDEGSTIVITWTR
jgi:hypothetical protein